MRNAISLISLISLLCTMATAVAQEQRFADLGTCSLESGEQLQDCRIGYRSFGKLSPARDNVILVPTWYTGRSENWLNLHSELLGLDHGYFVVVVDALGNGVSVSPSNSASQSGTAFPRITTRDMVHSQYRLATEVLHLEGVHAIMGISMGGMQAFEWAVLYPDFMEKVIPIAGSPKLGAYDVGLWETYKVLLELGEQCQCDKAAQAISGVFFLAGASPERQNASYTSTQVEQRIREATAERFATGLSLNYIRQADAMIATDVTRAFAGDWAATAEAFQAQLLVIVGSSDHVVTPGPAIEFAELLGDQATLIVFENDCGHNIPGCEMFRSRSLIREFLQGS